MVDFVPSTPKTKHVGAFDKKKADEGYFDLASDNSIVEEDRSSVKDKDKNISINLNKNF